MLAREAVRGARIDDRHVVVVDDRKTWRAEVVVLAAVHVTARHARADAAEIDVNTGAHAVPRDVENVLLRAGYEPFLPMKVVGSVREDAHATADALFHFDVQPAD